MDSYFEVLQDYLNNGAYTLEDGAGRIDYGVAAGKIDADQAAELMRLAQSNAGGRDIAGMIGALTVRVAALEAKVSALAESSGMGGELGGDVPDWRMPTGSHDAYAIGAKVRYNGSVWVSNIAANTTVPGSDPRWWSMVS